jgi:hypothetical protein
VEEEADSLTAQKIGAKLRAVGERHGARLFNI